MTIPQWNLLSRLTFRLYSSGGDCVDRPSVVFQDDGVLVVTPDSSASFASFARMLMQFDPGRTVFFNTRIVSEFEIISTVVVNNTPSFQVPSD